PNTSIAIRGQIVGIENSHLLIGPAIIRSEHLNSTLIAKIENLSKMTENGLDLSEIQADLKPDSKRTTIQQENITRRLNTLKGSLVQGTFTNYSAEPTSSGCVLVQYDGQSFKQRDDPDCILIFSPIKSKEAMEQVLPIIMSGKPIKFRGYIAEAKSGMIQIDPAILFSSTTVSRTEADQSSVMDSPATVAESDIAPAMAGERYPETRLQLLRPADLMDMNLNDLRYAINEMYARRGAVFKNAEIAKSFTSKEWFKPRPGVTFQEIEAEFSNIEADNLRLLGKERDRKAASADLYELIDSESNIREGPGTNYPIIRKSRKGEVGEHQSAKMGWMKLQFSDGSMGWVHEQNVKSKN
ncbi:MAG: SH3 domain-containing protein, partial [Akkermansiaceae bacterium]|nr:SH3 domain-containing protein [Akkermansiaceae bacterium]